MSNKKPLIAAVVGVIVIIIVVVIAVSLKPSGQPSVGGGTGAGTVPVGGAGPAQLPLGASTRTSAPQDAVAPTENATSLPANIAVPKTTAPANAANTATFRSYDIKVNGGKYIPDTIIVNQKDTVHINFTAVDRDYDFTQTDYGFKSPLPKGETKVVEFGASGQGDFTFYCSVCGGPEKGPQGHLVVTAPKKP
ncbi:MAG: cupredoxin domain-containing protein [Candidatus Liptonbacteria bacterium]|nr:cupredoxin domain-containing protein [Candidatus Liptonbacteria bacterium]